MTQDVGSGLGNGIFPVQVQVTGYQVNNPITCTGNLNLIMSVTGYNNFNLNWLRQVIRFRLSGYQVIRFRLFSKVRRSEFFIVLLTNSEFLC